MARKSGFLGDFGGRRRGFTLVEIMVVMAIIGIILMSIAGVGSYVRTQAQIKNSEAVIKLLVAALEEYKNYYSTMSHEMGSFVFPGNLEMLNNVPACRQLLDDIPADYAADTNGNSLRDTFFDAWKDDLVRIPLLYMPQGVGNFPVIRSAGPDMIFNTADDIISTELQG